MRRLYHIMGKSASGKDSIFKEIKKQDKSLKQMILYTTRPIRKGEVDGEAYHFITEHELKDLARLGRVIEQRDYDTAYGKWSYATVEDGQFSSEADFLMIGTLESYVSLYNKLGGNIVIPIYIEADDGMRLIRSLHREKKENNPRYDEICRRFLADNIDFSKDRLKTLGINRCFINDNLDTCVKEIMSYIKHESEE